VLNEFRQQVGLLDLPVVQVAITCQSQKAPLSRELNSRQMAMRLHNMVTVDASQLSLQEDGLHLDLQSNVRLGELLGSAFLQAFSHYLHEQMKALALPPALSCAKVSSLQA
jgi:hypothetical protein